MDRQNKDIHQWIELLESRIGDPKMGLPYPVFLFLSRLSPLTNVDLLIQDVQGRTLLSWREDEFHQGGWHVPGGIIRYKETMASRIQQVALKELGAKVEFSSVPLAVNEVIAPTRRDRGHFVSLLYRCRLCCEPSSELAFPGAGAPRPGQWAWHSEPPADLLDVHQMYRVFMVATAGGAAR